MKVIILILLFFSSVFCISAATPKKLVKILGRSVKAIDRVETLEGDFFIKYGAVAPGDNTILVDLQNRFVCKKVVEDTVCGLWFRENCLNLQDETKGFKTYYNGENWFSCVNGVGKKESAITARGSFVSGIFTKLFNTTQLYWQKVTWPDSLYKQQKDTNWIGEITLLKDTVISGNACYLVRNYKEGHRPKFDVVFSCENLLAIDQSSFLPVWTRSRFVRRVKGEVQMDQTTFNSLVGLRVNRKVDERIFTPEKFYATEKVEVAVVKEDCLIPDWKITTVEGKEFSKAGLFGKVYILAFGYIGCGACNMAIPEFKTVCEKYKDHEEVKVFYLNEIDGEKYFRQYGKEKGLPCELSVITQKCAANLGVKAYPHYYVVDRQGRIVKSIAGFTEGRKLGAELDRAVSAAL